MYIKITPMYPESASANVNAEKKQVLEHDWDGCTCTRCGKYIELGPYEYGVMLMEQKDYSGAIRSFEKGMKGPDGKKCTEKIFECIRLEYEQSSAAIARNDYSYFGEYLTSGLYSLEAKYFTVGLNRHPYTDQLKEQTYAVIIRRFEEKDYDSAREWFNKIRWIYKGTDPGLNRVIFKMAVMFINNKDYSEAVKWLQSLPDNYQDRDAKIGYCYEQLQRESRSPESAQRESSTGDKHSSAAGCVHKWEDVPGSVVVTIDCEIRKAGYYFQRCVYCGKEQKVIYDYDTDGY